MFWPGMRDTRQRSWSLDSAARGREDLWSGEALSNIIPGQHTSTSHCGNIKTSPTETESIVDLNNSFSVNRGFFI